MQGRTDKPPPRRRPPEPGRAAAPRAEAARCSGQPGAGPRAGESRVPRAESADTAPFISSLRAEIGEKMFNLCLGRSADVELGENGLRVTVPNRFIADMIEDRFEDAIRRALSACGRSQDAPLRVEVSPPRPGDHQAPPAELAPDRVPAPGDMPRTAPGPRPARPGSRRFSKRVHTFGSFIVGQCNRLAFETSRRFVEDDAPGQSGFRGPLFLFGTNGVGKSHLLAAIAGRFSELNPSARMRRLTAESFTNEYIAAIRSNTIKGFHSKYRRIKLLCIDDVHYLSKKTATQAELLHTLDALELSGARIVLASDAHPRQIRQINAALISRFISGSLVEISPPDRVTAGRLVRGFAERQGLVLDDEAVQVVVGSAGPDHTGPSARDLLGAVNRLSAYVGVACPDRSCAVDATLAAAALRPAGPANGVVCRPVPIDHIIAAVCTALGVTRADLAGRGRHKAVVLGRAMIALLARRLTKRSYPEIAAAIGNKSHSTVIAGHQRIEKQIAEGSTIDAGIHIDGTPLSILVDRLERALRTGC